MYFYDSDLIGREWIMPVRPAAPGAPASGSSFFPLPSYLPNASFSKLGNFKYLSDSLKVGRPDGTSRATE